MFRWFLETASFMPHGYCLLWQPELVMMHAVSDLLTAVSYFSIPIAIAQVIRQRGDIKFGPVPWLFVSFILLCGLNHIISLVTIVEPIYGAQALTKMAMAAVSVTTAILVWPLIPQVVAIPRVDELHRANVELKAALEQQERLLAELTSTRGDLENRERLLRQVVESVEEAVVVVDQSGQTIVANAAYRALAPTADADRTLKAEVEKACEISDTFGPRRQTIMSIARADQPDRSFGISVESLDNCSERLRVITLADVTGELTARSALKKTEQRLWQTIDAIPDGFAIYDADDKLVVANRAFYDQHEVFAHTAVKGATFENILRAAVASGAWQLPIAGREAWIATELAGRSMLTSSETVLHLASGRWVQRNDRRLDTGDMVSLFVDVTDHIRRETELRMARDVANAATKAAESARQRIEFEALHDPLTGLMNRRAVDAFIGEHLRTSAEKPLAMLHIDLDGFKHVNDTLGHAAGDVVLVEVANRIATSIRSGDFAGRLGGDEFLIVLQTAISADEALAVAERIIAAIGAAITIGDKFCRVGASIGIAISDGTFQSLDELLAASDVALYDAKKAGRNRAHLYGEDLRTRSAAIRISASELVRDLDRDRISPFYQPQISARTGEIVGCEALARWNHPERGILPPAEFLGVAAAMGIEHKIDQAILDAVARDLRQWDRQGLPPIKVSVNLSDGQLRSADFIKHLHSMFVYKDRICFEVLESVFLDQSDELVHGNLRIMRNLGFQIDLDDFGSGHASIVGLTRLKPDRLKIDRQIVQPIVTDPRASRIVRCIVEIGHCLDVAVTAEGVETEEHRDALVRAGVQYLQGYAISRPLAPEAFVDFINRWTSGIDRRTG